MKNENKIFRKIRKLSIEISKESAYKDENNLWWGFDTEIGDLPFKIQKRLSKFVDWLIKENLIGEK